ncbi:beta-propeller domain-containing protein, partial [Candidatus Parcubacteria bacterium]|nr:beta-propeller domain-containing protein [Candidatus Parcubacteria bacterium]
PDIYYFDIPYNSYNITSIHAINIKDENEKINGDVYLMNRNQNMYVSQNNIYVTYTKHISEYQLAMEVMKDIILPIMNEKDQNKINNINEVDNYILSPDEKQRKISNIIERFLSSQDKSEQDRLEEELEKAMKKKYADISKELEKTVIHKIAINKNDIEYKTHGEVTGHVLNQFSMDENKGYFRIATTKNRTWSRFEDGNTKSYNNLYVLDGRLKIVGSLEGLAEDERIKSVRFMQNRAYMVTFKQIDPLFVIDLKNPKKPTVLGELKIPGYSDYLHPYDEDTLIGLGKDAYENRYGGTVTGGVKLSLFDVADVKNPKEIDTFIMGVSGSDSIALHDHKAFLFSHDKNLLSIPVTIRKQSGEKYYNTKLEFSGAAVFTVDKSSFKLKGKIDHSDGGKDSKTDYWRGYNYYDNNVKRALYIEDNLYTFSNKYIMIHAIDDLNKINNVRFVEEEKDFEIENLKESKSKFLNLDNLGIKNSE